MKGYWIEIVIYIKVNREGKWRDLEAESAELNSCWWDSWERMKKPTGKVWRERVGEAELVEEDCGFSLALICTRTNNFSTEKEQWD